MQSESVKPYHDTDRGLKLIHVKLECRVIAYQNEAVNPQLSFVLTARQRLRMT